jgi:hypothetical protein
MEMEMVTVSREKKSDSIHKNCIEVYSDFIKGRTGVGAKIGGSGGKAMKTIIEYLSAQVRTSHPEYEPDRVNTETVAAWNWVLSKFEKWDPFHKGQLKLEQINSNLINIISSIKNGNTNGKKGFKDQQSELERLSDEAKQRLADHYSGRDKVTG